MTCFFMACDAVKRVEATDYLLTENSFFINGQKKKSEELTNLSFQKKNVSLLGAPLRLHIYNLARPHKDSIFEAWLQKNPKRKQRLISKLSEKQLNQLKTSAIGFNRWLKNTGEAPVLLDSLKINKTKLNLERYYFANGWFDRTVNYKVDTVGVKRAALRFEIETGTPYSIGVLSERIDSPVIDTLYNNLKSGSYLKKGDQFKISNFDNERSRLTTAFRNSGAYHFSEQYIRYENDTIGIKNKVNVKMNIQDRIIRNDDSIVRVPFQTYRIKDVNIYTDATFENRSKTVSDSVSYNNYNVYAHGKLKYRPEALTDAVLITKGGLFKDLERARTYRYLNELKTFKYPNIEYVENPQDTTLTANIYLTPKKKYGLGFDVSVSQSNIQKVGLSFTTGIVIRNIFKGAETLQISGLGAIGASKDGASAEDGFFDINELGADIKLNIPRLFFPVNTDKIIPKYMSPSTQISTGFTGQTNIGLDKQTFNSVFRYKWFPSEKVTNTLDLVNLQYVRNLNPTNYFSVYQNSFNRLQSIALDSYSTPAGFFNTDANGQQSLLKSRADEFINLVNEDVLYKNSNPNEYQTVRNIQERKSRLVQDNFILASNFNYVRNSRENPFDTNFSIFRVKFELAGNLLYTASKLLNLENNSEGAYKVSGVPFSQYIKSEIDHIKLWNLGRSNVLALRSFFGIAIPLGNSTSIPFSKSFFAGGSNDNRAWTAYNLGPGRSDNNNEFNEANMKLAFSLEYRYNLFGNLNGAFFMDAGNIWNVLDDVTDTKANFDTIRSLEDIAVGAGIGLRYDFSFFILRFDTGFKAYEPTFGDQNRWLNNFNFSKAVYNIGINYPF
ncbi:BamA/TamA family outer membrane protein [Flavobacteriaceae bacterium]|jgi:outer membrane protein assembly factor BamA|nr:BamA/TamA family outer membrane protein [Flavobacteriaceae bacterium]MDA7727807.1 BamA/TamA family outer membrane protein [Flavobacteriaceae bacterium]MDG1309565.1 BamA/TamA family outer membrane protein [Flavobacteriaceae bacterium]